MLHCSSLYCKFGMEVGQCCCNATAYTAVLESRVALAVWNGAACTAGLDLRMANGVAMQQLVLQSWENGQ